MSEFATYCPECHTGDVGLDGDYCAGCGARIVWPTPAVPSPERPDTEDAYLRCITCGWSYPIETTPADEVCANGNCGGHLVYAIGDWNGSAAVASTGKESS